MDAQVIATIVGPVLTAALAGLGLLLKEWRTRRRWEHRRDEILDQGRKQVAFISDWVVAYGHVTGPGGSQEAPLTQARRDLDAIYEQVATQTRSAAEQRPDRRTRADYVSILLLRGVRRPWARVSRVFYFAFLGTAVFSGVIMTTFSFTDDELPFVQQLAAAVMVTGVYLVPVALLHVLTRHLDRPRGGPRLAPDAGVVGDPAPPRPAAGQPLPTD